MAEDRVINLEIKDNVKTLKQQYKEAVQEVQKLVDVYGETSIQVAEAAKRAAELKDKIEDSNDAIKAFKGEGVFNATGKAVQSVASGFSAVEGAVGLVGVESEALQETMLRVQSAMALAQGLEGLEDAGRAFGTLKTVAVSAFKGMTTAGKLFAVTGIGLLITAITLLITNFDKVVKFIQPIIDGVKAIGDAIGLTDFAGEERAKNEKRRNEDEARQLEKVRRARENAYNNEQKALDRLIALRGAEGKSTIELQKQKAAASIAYQKELLKEAELALEVLLMNERRFKRLGVETDTLYDEQIKKIEELKNGILDNENQLKIIDINAKQDNKKRAEDAAKDARDLRRAIEDEEIKAIEDKNQREQTQLIVSAQRRIEDLSLTEKDRKKNANLIKQIEENLVKDLDKLDKEWNDIQLEAIKNANNYKIQQERELAKTIEDIAEQNYQRTLTEQEKEILAVNDKYFELETLAQGNADALNEIELAKLNELNDINLKYDEEDKARKDAKDAEDKERRKRNRDFAVEMTLSGLNTISSLTELFGKKSEKAAKRAFQINKAAQIASATITTYKSATDAYASQFVPLPDATSPVRGGIAAGLAVAAGLANIAKIASQKFEGGGSSGGGGGTGAGGGGNVTAPQFNVIGSSGINQLAQLTQQPVQAYVVSGEVTSAQALDRNRQKNATL